MPSDYFCSPHPILSDTHCHLDFPAFASDQDQAIRRALESGVGYMINIGANLDSSAKSVELTARYEKIWAAVGIHPHDADSFDAGGADAIRKLASEKKVVAIGEIGLDYYRNRSKKKNQQAMFEYMLSLSRSVHLPVVVHNREADEDLMHLLEANLPHPARGVIHCFSSGMPFLKKVLDLGFFVSFTANITYPKAGSLRELAGFVPLDRLLLETDSPYLAPQGMRGKRNEPAFVRFVAEAIAALKGIEATAVARQTFENGRRLFGL
jgi:TatD DNase family protein